jgi:organic radical activating enzyme
MSVTQPKFFPIKTATSCRIKWSQSTVWLNSGKTASCCRASKSEIGENFDLFHNTDKKVKSRQQMLLGEWPGDGCEYCGNIELSGATSERQFQNQIPDVYPAELDSNPSAVVVEPSSLEIFFSNTCNLKCIYCSSKFSSSIQAENNKFGGSIILENEFKYEDNQYNTMVPKFWKWFNTNSIKLQRLQVLGGEPLLQKDVIKLIDYFEEHPHPNLEFNLVTNLSVPHTQLVKLLDRLSNLVTKKLIKRIDIQTSIECWGQGQEYIRNGVDLDTFDTNMRYMLNTGNCRIGLLSTINTLSILTMPDLCNKYLDWNKTQTICWYMHLVMPADDGIFSPLIFDYSVFESSLTQVSSLLPNKTWDDKMTCDTFLGITNYLKKNCKDNLPKQKELIAYLNENDRRRNSNWQTTFPWLKTILEKNNVV